MTSRRRFFQVSSIAVSALASASSRVRAEAVGDLNSQRNFKRDLWNDLPNYMTQKVNSARSKRKAGLAAIISKAEADERIAFIRQTTWQLIGGKPDPTALNARTTGVIDRQSYRIEKVIFESQPEFYVTAHLYIPKSGKAPYPGILAPVGHASEGKSYRSYQTLFQNLARQGFAVLAFDPPGQGERLQYLDAATNGSVFGPTGEHDRFGIPALLIGSTTTQFEAWDGIRAVDYLLSRPEIDSTRIGCCGHSGGGTQTMFLCALEPRIHAAVAVEGHTENLAGANYEPPGAYADAEQNLIGSLKVPLDRGDLLAAFAPKPLLICYTPVDTGTTYSPTYVEGTEEIVSELKNLYKHYGAAEKVGLFNSTLPHDYDYFQRRSTYKWFNQWLMNDMQAAEEVAFEDAPESSLWCTSTGQVLTSIGGRAAFQVNHDRLRAVRSQLNGVRREKKGIQEDLHEILGLPSKNTDLRAISVSNNKHRDVIVEEIEFESEPGIRVPGWFVKPATGGPAFPVALMIEDRGKDGLFDRWPLVDQCTRAGVALCTIDLRSTGITNPRFPSAGPDFYGYGLEFAYSMVNLTIGSPIVGQQTWDLVRCLDYLNSRSDVDPKRVGLYGSGLSGIPCLAAANLDDRVHSLLLYRTLADLECIVASKEYKFPLSSVAFGILRKFDLPDLCAALAPRALWLINSTGPQGVGLTLSEIRERCGKTAQAYENVQPAGSLVIRVDASGEDAILPEWLGKTI